MKTLGTLRGWSLAIPLAMVFALSGCGKADDASSSGGSVAADAPMQKMADSSANKLSVQTRASAFSPLGGAPASPASGSITESAVPTGGVRVNMSGKLASAPMNTAAPAYQSRQVIRKADLDIRVENVEKAEKSANAIVEKTGGYVDSASSTDLASTHPELSMTVRVPVGTFDNTIARFEALGVRLSKTINSDDVTGHIVDMDAQLKTLRIQAEIYRNMLKGRSQLSEVFEIQQQLTQVQTQIEDIDSRRKTESGLAALSTITLKLEQNGVVSQPSTDPGWMAQSWAGSTSGASAALRCVTVAAMWILCFAPFWLPAAFLIRKLVKNGFSERQAPAPPMQL